jgi:hypothetical protein
MALFCCKAAHMPISERDGGVNPDSFGKRGAGQRPQGCNLQSAGERKRQAALLAPPGMRSQPGAGITPQRGGAAATPCRLQASGGNRWGQAGTLPGIGERTAACPHRPADHRRRWQLSFPATWCGISDIPPASRNSLSVDRAARSGAHRQRASDAPRARL